jgi:hypothetical protein
MVRLVTGQHLQSLALGRAEHKILILAPITKSDGGENPGKIAAKV